LTIQISPTAPLGNMTFDIYYYRGDIADAVRHVSVTVRIVAVRYPSVVGRNGDVHAGGGVGVSCTPTSGTIAANPAAASYGEYVVSASGAGITDFDSNGPGGGNTLKVGSNGGYDSFCRPDLYQAAYDFRYVTGGAGYITRPSGSYQIASFGNNSIVYIDGNATLHGVVNNKQTIIVAGDVTIDGDIKIVGSKLPHDAPSLGIIASGDINISNAATSIDAFLFSDGTIDTCYQGVAAKNACNSILTLRGFLMGSNLLLHRLGPLNASAQNGQSQIITENIILMPQLYLNPPKFFDGATIDDRLLEGQGERAPLF
jgi:hypothetical protein